MVQTWIVGSKPHHDVSIVRHGDGILEWGQVELSVQQTAAIEIESMAQVDLLDGGIGRAAHTDHVEQVTCKWNGWLRLSCWTGIKWRRNVTYCCNVCYRSSARDPTFIYQDDFDDRVQWDVNRVGAHAVRAAVWWAVISVTELLWWDVLDLGQHRRRW